jgi:hypothetical protein
MVLEHFTFRIGFDKTRDLDLLDVGSDSVRILHRHSDYY